MGNGSQTSYVLALHFRLLPQALRSKAAEWLVSDVRRRGGALSTGMVGTQFLLDVLADHGYASLAYDLLLRTEYPSWGYMIAQGTTTMWESWNGRVWSGPKGETMPSSLNHYALSAVCGFLFRRIAGIVAAEPGFKKVLIRPVLDPRIKRGGADYDSVMGRISIDWEQPGEGGFKLSVIIPPNTRARIYLPTTPHAQIFEGRTGMIRHKRLQSVRLQAQEAAIEVGSGAYDFVVRPSASEERIALIGKSIL